MEFDVEPYYDDFATEGGAKDENYMRILFRPGYAVQARELTQIQSILQNQIKSFGDHIFQDGSPVQGGHMVYDNKVKSVILQASDNFYLSDFNNKLLINSAGSAIKRAIVLATDDSLETSTQSGALLIRYLTGDQFSNGEQIEVATDSTVYGSLLSSNAIYTGSVVSINEGIFYVDGFFIYVPPQTIVLSSTSTTPTYRIGLEIDETIIDESTDTNLLDPAQGSFNYQAPGGTRYQYNLVLSKRLLDSVDDSRFFELLRIENGVITKQVKYPIYSEIGKTLARRTDDQSGSFTVKPFRITMSDDSSNTSNVIVNVEPGKAYVKGFEYETVGVTRIKIPRARDTANSLSYDLSLEYGNFVVTTNVASGNSGFLDISTLPSIDLHTVPVANINTSAVANYTNTKIGTARVKNMQWHTSNVYYAYLVDINTQPLVVNVDSSSVNTSYLTLPTSFSLYNNAYANVQVKIIAGNGSATDIRTITSYDGSTRRAFVDRPFTTTLDTSSRASLLFGTKDVDSLVVTPTSYTANVYYAQNANIAQYSSMDIHLSGRDYNGNTLVFGTELNKAFHNLPESYIKKGSFGSTNYQHRKFVTKTTTSNVITLSYGAGDLDVNEEFPWGNGFMTGSYANAVFMVVIKDKKTSSFSNGQILLFSDSGISGANKVQTTATNALTIYTSDPTSTNTFTADVIFTVKENDSQSYAVRLKDLRGNTSNTTLRSTDVPTNGAAITGDANVWIDSTNAIIWFTNASSTQISTLRSPGSKQSLYLSDVVSIIKIYDSQDTTANVSSTKAFDVTNRYLFDSGQRDNYYDHASITLKAGAAPPIGRVGVMVQYYEHTGGATKGYFSADSYPQIAYDQNRIPYYSSEKYGTVSLRDCIDFRPSRPNRTTAAFSVSGNKLPYPYQQMGLAEYSFYLPRIDKLILKSDGQFSVVRGTPAVYPTIPLVSQDSLSLYNITLPAYTPVAKDILIDYIENKRYTMKDIGNLEKRIENLEYYTSLNALENAAASQSILDNKNAPKEKYGIIADQFDDFSIADVTSQDLACHISKNRLKPYQVVEAIQFNLSSVTGMAVRNGKTYSVSYTETPCVVQNAASKSVTIQPYQFASFIGNITLTPETDFWFSTTQLPEVLVSPTESGFRDQPQTSIAASTDSSSPTASTSSTPPVTGTTTSATSVTTGVQRFGNLSFPFINGNMVFNVAGWGTILQNNWNALPAATQAWVEAHSSQATVSTPTQTATSIGNSIQLGTSASQNIITVAGQQIDLSQIQLDI